MNHCALTTQIFKFNFLLPQNTHSPLPLRSRSSAHSTHAHHTYTAHALTSTLHALRLHAHFDLYTLHRTYTAHHSRRTSPLTFYLLITSHTHTRSLISRIARICFFISNYTTFNIIYNSYLWVFSTDLLVFQDYNQHKI